MRRLSFLLLGLLLAAAGAGIADGGESFAPYLLRDALLLGGLGSLVFALNAAGWLPPPVLRRWRGLPRTGWTLLLTGLVVAIGSGLGLALGLEGIAGQAAAIAWGLGLALQLAGAWWPGAASEYAAPATRWSRDGAGNVVPQGTGTEGAGLLIRRRPAPTLSVRSWSLWLLAVLLLAALLRFWDLSGLPPGCIGEECTTALGLLEPAAQSGQAASQGLALDLRLAGMLAHLVPSSLLALRLAGALLGWLTVLFTALALRRLVLPLPALLGAALLAINPWHLWAGRSSDPALAAACLASLALWLGLEALARGHARWWLPWGVATGLLAAQMPAAWPGVLLWALVVIGLGLALARQQRGRVGAGDYWRWPLCGLAAALGAALPGWAGAVLPSWPPAGDLAASAVTLLAALLPSAAGSPLQGGPLAGGLLPSLSIALALAGAGALLRHLRQPAALLVLAGAAALAGAATLRDPLIQSAATTLLPLLPLLIALAVVALERLLAALVGAWGPPLVRTSSLLAGSALLILLLAGRGSVMLLWQLDSVRSGGGVEVGTDMARYIADQLAATGEEAVTYVAPQPVLDHPSLRLLAGAALAADRVQPLALGRTLPYAQTPAGAVEYLLPLLDTQTLELLRELYPDGQAATELDAEGTTALFNRFRVDQAALLRAQSLSMSITSAAPGSTDASAEPLAAVTSLDFAWATAPPRPEPFTAQWIGSLITPVSGNYTFAVEGGGGESVFTLTVDDILLLDSSLALRQQQIPLPRGIHRLRVDYRSGSQPGDLRVTWQREGEAAQTLAAPFVHSPQLADQGLLGDYYGNERFEGPVVALHKDPILGLDPELPLPWSVVWHGLLAAPRSGEYLIGVDAPGAAQITVNGQLLADNRNGATEADGADEAASSYSEGLIYLPAGWHGIEVRYAATAAGAAEEPDKLRLLWQPPGGNPSELASRYLLPAYGVVGLADAPLPPLPPVSDTLLGDDRFALARPSTAWQPYARIPAAGLPPLPLERLWQVGGVCGDGADQLNAPHGAAFSTDGSRLYVADTGNRRIQVLDAGGQFLAAITADVFQEPVDVAADANGVLMLDALAQGVHRIGQGGEVITLPLQTSFYRPRGLAVDAAGNLIAADTGGGRVVVLAQDGTPTLEFGGQGSLLARGQPVAVLAPPGVLWALSAEDGRLWNLTADGSLTAVQPTGTVDGPHLAQLSDGRLLASDPGRATFVLFSPLGEPLAQFGYSGELQLPTGIAASRSADGDVIAVVDTRACAVSAWRLAQ